tara:strand:- start:6197 stop:7069 length:873 start_codon:yes stop_codon:yes gene_type:complete
MKILVTGSNSQIAKSIYNLNNLDKFKVLFCDKKKLDITNKENINKIFNFFTPDLLINCAAYTNVNEAEKNKNKANLINNYSLESLSRICNDFNTKMIHFSTDYVFNGNKKNKYIEEDNTDPKSVYGLSKLEGENKIRKHCNNYLILRVSWLFSEFNENFVTFVINNLKKNQDFFAVKDLYSIPTSSEDLSYFLVSFFQDQKKFKNSNTFHFVNNGEEVSWFNFSREIYKIYSNYDKSKSKIIPITSNEFFKNNIRPSYSVLDNRKISKTYKLKIANWKNTLNETIKRILR